MAQGHKAEIVRAAAQLLESPPGSAPGSLDCLFEIAAKLLPEWAGSWRESPAYSGVTRYASPLYLRPAAKAVETLPQDNFAEIIVKYVEMNLVHPLPLGNGPILRVWLDLILLARHGLQVDWSKIGIEEYISALGRSAINDLELRTVILPNLMVRDTPAADRLASQHSSWSFPDAEALFQRLAKESFPQDEGVGNKLKNS